MQSDAGPAEAEQVAEQQKDAADPSTKHRTTPDSLRKEPAWQEEQARQTRRLLQVTQLEANQAQVTNIGEACTTNLVLLQLSCCTQAWRAEELKRRFEACAQHIKRVEESQFESYTRVGDSISADYDVTRMCKEGAKCSARKPDLVIREGPSTRQSLNMWLKTLCGSRSTHEEIDVTS